MYLAGLPNRGSEEWLALLRSLCIMRGSIVAKVLLSGAHQPRRSHARERKAVPFVGGCKGKGGGVAGQDEASDTAG